MPTSPKKLIEKLNEYRLENDCTWDDLSLRVAAVQPEETRNLTSETIRCIIRRKTANDRNLRKIERFLNSLQAEAEVRA